MFKKYISLIYNNNVECLESSSMGRPSRILDIVGPPEQTSEVVSSNPGFNISHNPVFSLVSTAPGATSQPRASLSDIGEQVFITNFLFQLFVKFVDKNIRFEVMMNFNLFSKVTTFQGNSFKMFIILKMLNV